MTFELSSASVATRDQARAFARSVRARAAEIDRAAAVPVELVRELATLDASDAMALVVAVEEVAVASAAVAAGVVAGNGGPVMGLSGLRGASAPEETPRAQLALAAIALGVGRAALESALAEVRQTSATPAEVEKPQWLVADVATELDAARLLTYKAASTMSDADIALARLLASAAAQRAVDAAVRVAGASALADGSALERLARDMRVLSVLLGSEERHRAIAAEGLLPR
jgi:alkylation response protein AidB-like acyl-CoA dehydrogenase